VKSDGRKLIPVDSTQLQRLSILLGLRPKDIRRLFIALVLILSIVVVGTIGYMLTAELNPLDALYMTVITISTVGYGELGNVGRNTRVFTIILIFATMIWGAWASESLLSTILSEEFRQTVFQLRSIRKVRDMKNHTILCGFGRIGEAAASELVRNKEPFVVVEQNPDIVEHLRELNYHVISGDATEDDVLLAAGVRQAARLLTTLNDDNANIVTTLSARELNPNIWIASRLVRVDAYHKLLRAGANEVVSPYDYGGRRLALTVLRPHVAEFLSEVVFDEGRGAEMDEIQVREGSELAGKTLAEANLRQRFGITVISLYHGKEEKTHPDIGRFELNPGPDTRLRPGDVLIIVGTSDQLQRLHNALKT
jgi:voltage-gated potassium channel